MSLFTGDILALAATDKAVFTAGADGSLRRWALGKLGELSAAEVRDKAHDGRITALAVSGSLLFSAGYDGSIKVRTVGGWLRRVWRNSVQGNLCLMHTLSSAVPVAVNQMLIMLEEWMV